MASARSENTMEPPAKSSAQLAPMGVTTTNMVPTRLTIAYSAPLALGCHLGFGKTSVGIPRRHAQGCVRLASTVKRVCGSARSAGKEGTSRRAKVPSAPRAQSKRPHYVRVAPSVCAKRSTTATRMETVRSAIRRTWTVTRKASPSRPWTSWTGRGEQTTEATTSMSAPSRKRVKALRRSLAPSSSPRLQPPTTSPSPCRRGSKQRTPPSVASPRTKLPSSYHPPLVAASPSATSSDVFPAASASASRTLSRSTRRRQRSTAKQHLMKLPPVGTPLCSHSSQSSKRTRREGALLPSTQSQSPRQWSREARASALGARRACSAPAVNPSGSDVGVQTCARHAQKI